MEVCLLIILFFNYINCIDIPGTFNFFDLLSSYITPKNDMLVFIKNTSSLYKYKLNSKFPFYTNRDTLTPKEFPKNETIEDIHFNFRHLNFSTINITYFNENYTSYYIYNPEIENNINYSHISFEVIEKNKLILFLHPTNYSINYSTINIVEFDSKSKEKLKIKKTYFFKASSLFTTTNCVNTVGNNIICGLIEYNTNKTIFEFSLMYFSELEQFPNKVSIINQTNYYKNLAFYHIIDTNFLYYFIKLFLFSEEKIIFCFNSEESYNSTIKCRFVQDKNNTMVIDNNTFILTQETTKLKRFEYFKKSALNGVKINDTQIILNFYNYEKKYIEYFNITLNKNMEHKIESSYDSSIKLYGFYSLYLLKYNDDNLVSIMVTNSKAQFKEYGYTTCSDSYNYLYNGEQKSLSFTINSLFKTGENTVIFLNKTNRKFYSIIDTYSNKPINYLVKYDKSKLKYIYNSNDYYYIKNYGMRLSFTSGLNEKKHQTCELILAFYGCARTECEICTSRKSYDCYDRYWNAIAPPKEPIKTTDFEKYFFILPLSILAMLIVLIFFSFAKCCVREPLPNYGGNLIQNEMPLIQS